MMITPDRLTSLFRPRRVALVGASDKSTFSLIAYRNLVEFGFADRTYLVNRRGADTHGQPTVTSCAQIGAPVDVAYLMVPQAGTLDALAGAAAALGRLRRPGIGIVSISGGACDIVADRADELGAELPELAEPTRAALAAVMPSYGTVQNPLDVTGAAVIDPSLFTSAIAAMSRDPSVGVVGVINSLPWIDDGRPYLGQVLVDAIGAGMRAAACPTAYINQVMQPVTGYTRAAMERGGVPYAIPGLRQAVVALRNVAWWSEATRALLAEPGGPAADTVLADPVLADPVLADPVLADPVLAAVAAEGGLGETAARRGPWSEAAARRLLAAAGVPVVPAELAASAAGAVKAAAGYGVPVSPRRARQLLGRLRGRAVLEGSRGAAPADLDALAAVIARVGDLALALGEDLAALEVNPLRVDGPVIEALDALVTWKD